MDAVAQALRHFVVNLGPEPGQAAEPWLDVTARAAEAVVEVEMAERGNEVIDPHQPHDAATQPDAFRIAGRAVDRLGSLCKFVGLALAVLCSIGRRRAGF